MINPDTLAWLYEYDNLESDIEWHADFIFNNGTIHDTVEEIGFRLRGNTSRYSAKKSFKVSFNTFHSGRKFYGVEKMNLNGEHNDPSIIRSRLCWEMLRDFGVPAPRATHAEVYINGNYHGLYIYVEHIDEEFTESRFGNQDGNLYKCLWPCDLAYLGDDPDAYKLMAGDRRVYELKINEEQDDYSDLAHFIDVLNNSPDDELFCELQKVFNLEDYLKVIAVDVITGDWDGYIFNKNNMYLYHNTTTGKFEYIPYDMDNTFGIDWFNIDWGNRDIYAWEMAGGEQRPLYTRLMANPQIRDQFSFYMGQLLAMLGDQQAWAAHVDSIKDMIMPYVADDPYYPLDYGYGIGAFQASYEQATGAHVKYGLKPFLQTRLASAQQQLVLNDIRPVIKYLDHAHAIPGEEYWVRAFVEDEDAWPVVRLAYRINGGPVQYQAMLDDGGHHDFLPGDGYYGCAFPELQLNTVLAWQVEATDDAAHSLLYPCEPVVENLSPSEDPQLFINEFMASNDTTIADENGEYDDWVEIYNGDDEAVWLGDKYLSDNLENPTKFAFPDITLQPGEFLIIWCDGQPDQGPLHADYKLDAEGEEIGIFDSESTGYFLLDSVTFGPQQTDISIGREHDGQLPWVAFMYPTPGYSNQSFEIEEIRPALSSIKFYPNPVSGNTIYFTEPFTGKMFDGMGRVVLEGEEVMRLEVGGLQAGVYLLYDNGGRVVKVIVW